MNFSKEIRERVWQKVQPKPGEPNRGYDICGSEIDKSAYGDENSDYGWEIDHVIPLSRGGSSSLRNLQPLHWENNRDKGDLTQKEWNCGN